MRAIYNEIVILVVILFFTGCTTTPPPKGVEDFPYGLMVNIFDLSTQYKKTGSEFPVIDGAFAYSISYRNKKNALFTHQIAIYRDSKSASDAYSLWESQWFNKNWTHPSDLTYNPKNNSDLYQLKCMDVKMNELPTRSCRMLQLHKNLIILVLTNINSESIDFTTFEDVLTKLDARLPTGDIPMPGQ